MEIGEKIRNLRQKMGLTQEELAERSDLTKGYISQLEHSNTSPTVENLSNVVSALGTNLSDFFKEEKRQPVVYKAEDALSVVYEEIGLKISWLVKDSQKNEMEPVIMEIEEGGQSKVYKPFEGESFGYVLKGRVNLYIGSDKYSLSEGDSFYFEVNKQNYLENKETETAKVLWVLSPPNF